MRDIALRVVRTGTDKVNHKILKMLPTNIDNLMKEIKLTKVPINIRINNLEKVGLVHRWRGTGKIEITEFGKFFLGKIDEYMVMARENMYEMFVKTVRDR